MLLGLNHPLEDKKPCWRSSSVSQTTTICRCRLRRRRLACTLHFDVLAGPNAYFPLTWCSVKQTATSRSTTESEVVSLPNGVLAETLPMLVFLDLALKCKCHPTMKEDNQATITAVKKGFSEKLRCFLEATGTFASLDILVSLLWRSFSNLFGLFFLAKNQILYFVKNWQDICVFCLIQLVSWDPGSHYI